MKTERIGIIGAGNMGEALIRGFLHTNVAVERLIVSDKNKKRRDYIRKKYCISVTRDNLKVVASSSIIILAVKPQDAGIVLSEIAQNPDSFQAYVSPRHSPLFISIVAGLKTKDIESRFRYGVRIVRVMPNAPALIGEGVSAICLGRYAELRDYGKAESLFKAVGEVVRVEESLMDKITAISGSGPAYFFLLMKYLTDIGVRLGLTRDTAERLVNHTAQGSAKMVIETKQRPEDLMKKVASKGGTTEAALEVFARRGWEKIIEQGIRAAVRRARELRRN